MNHLKSLAFTTVARGAANPVLARRANLIARLEDQKNLAKDPNYAPTITRWVKGPDGIKQRVELKKPLRPAWRTDVTGAIVLTVRYGFKADRVREGEVGHRGAVEGEARQRYRHADRCCTCGGTGQHP